MLRSYWSGVRPDAGDHLGCSCLLSSQHHRHNQLQHRDTTRSWTLNWKTCCCSFVLLQVTRKELNQDLIIRTGAADTVRAAARWLTPQRVAGGTLPAFVTAAQAIHAVAMSTAVCWLAAARMNAQDGGDTASTAPPAI